MTYYTRFRFEGPRIEGNLIVGDAEAEAFCDDGVRFCSVSAKERIVGNTVAEWKAALNSACNKTLDACKDAVLRAYPSAHRPDWLQR